jgi:hypothetical protein
MPTRETNHDTRTAPTNIAPDDPRYHAVVDKRFNKRFRETRAAEAASSDDFDTRVYDRICAQGRGSRKNAEDLVGVRGVRTSAFEALRVCVTERRFEWPPAFGV